MQERKLKILQVSCEGLGNGGVQRIIMSIKKNINCYKSDILLFTNERRYYDDEFESLNGTIYRIPLSKKKSLFTPIKKYFDLINIYIKLNKILKKNKYDIIHCHNELYAGICIKAAKKNGVKIRISHHHRNDYDEKSRIELFYVPLKYILKKYIIKYSTDIICCSNDTKNTLFGEINDPKIKVLYNTIDLNHFININREKHKNIVITNVGAYSDNKNQRFLLKIADKLDEEKIKYTMYLIGYGKYKEILHRIIQQNNLNNVHLIDGLSENKEDFLKFTDLFLFPSKKEGFGISLLEAQSMGIQCIASDTINKEVNIGLVEYLTINDDKMWVEYIKNFNKNTQKSIDYTKVQKYDDKYYFRELKKIYRIK